MSDPFKFVSLDELRASSSPIVGVTTADQSAARDCRGPITYEELKMMFSVGPPEPSDLFEQLCDVIQECRDIADEVRSYERQAIALIRQGLARKETPARSNSQLVKAAEIRQRTTPGNTHQLEAFLSQRDASPSSSDLSTALRKADVVMGFDSAAGKLFMVYGQEALEDFARTGEMRNARVICLDVDEKTEISRLCTLIQCIKGRHDYRGSVRAA